MKKKLLSLALAAVMVVMMGTPAFAVKLSRDYPFTDVPSSHWAYDAVYFCWSYDIVEGVTDNEFSPSTTLTRAQFITMMGLYPLMAYKNYIDFPYEDVPSNHWARLAVNFCWKNDITEGVSETEFAPDGTLTKAQFITMMGRNLYIDNVQAQMLSSDNWYSSYVRYLSNNGYLDGVATDEDSLSQGISRQEMALIMYNMCKEYNSELDFDYSNALSSVTDVSNIESNYIEAVKFCYYTGLLSGYEDGSFDPTGTLSRAEGATVIMRTYYWADLKNTSRTTLLSNGIPEDIVNQTICNLIIENINDWREENGLKRLETMEFMNEACMVRAEECSVSFSHTRPNGEVAGTVYDDLFGLKMGAGENIASNPSILNSSLVDAANALFEQWKNSPGHNANMLRSADYIGCGVYASSNNLYSATHILTYDDLELGGYDFSS